MLDDKFVEIFKRDIHRLGADQLLDWMETETDFFTAPASSKHHLARPGGLCEHSINVHNWLKELYGPEDSARYAESIAISALLHDLRKATFYEPTWRNQKTYDPEKVKNAPQSQVKHDPAGDFIWETVPSYIINETFPYGHGEKSVYLIQKYMDLTDDEAVAIRYHMASWGSEDKNAISAAFRKYPLAFWLHVADEAATFMTETEAK